MSEKLIRKIEERFSRIEVAKQRVVDVARELQRDESWHAAFEPPMLIRHDKTGKIVHELSKTFGLKFKKCFDDHFGEFEYETNYKGVTIHINTRSAPACKIIKREQTVTRITYEADCSH